MQSKQQIRQLISSAGAYVNKRLGQNFLIDLNLIRLLVDSANVNGGDVVLEVGCGTGSLSEELAEKAGKLIAVEIDETLAQIAKGQLADRRNVEVINSDVLASKNTIRDTVIDAIEQAHKEYSGRFLLVANLPYSVAAALMVNLAVGQTITDAMYVTVQKEVAQRMTALPGGKDYGILSIFLGATGEVKTIRILRPAVFWPQPQVDSAMVSFVRDEKKASRIRSMEIFREVVSLFMGHRRKMLKACSKLAVGRVAEIGNWAHIFELCSVDPQARPNSLSAGDYVAIANLCAEYLKSK